MDIPEERLNPKFFEWKGPVITGFDEKECAQLIQLRYQLGSFLSPKKRLENTKYKMISEKTHLEFLANFHLMQLDFHDSLLKFDRRELSLSNVGMAESIGETDISTTLNQGNYYSSVNQKKAECSQIEIAKREQLKSTTDALQKQAKEKQEEAKQKEYEASQLKKRSDEYSKKKEKYCQYKEWQRLKKDLNALQTERRAYERFAETLSNSDKNYPF
ncbi:hypothetical protein TRFO_27119 [Tritrichomonas foetus]|uniref:Uncharacterized protein n=1 Tax=Tritrichomonas foetus TaxID=1144522 RepID=A0A1J4K2P7_9EUKA|nr:hypothetical protein TRFO_27119 [Tritrichomonas foetus]|eukprot:OHT05242.1 hypothetical protein TRFO_27119 [Tritrichomonas foetus]